MTKRLDPDVKTLKACVRALLCSSSLRMLGANVEYLYDRFERRLGKRDIEAYQEARDEEPR